MSLWYTLAIKSHDWKKKSDMNPKLKRIGNILGGVVVVLAVVLAAALVGVRLVGLRPFVVLSGSMEPAYPVGSLIYVKEADYKSLAVGDVITFLMDEDTVVTHRIIEILPDESEPDTLRFVTQGDANDAPDGSTVHYKNILGKPVLTVPGLGYLADYIQHPPGSYVAVSVGAILLLLAFLPDLFAPEGEKSSQPRRGGKHTRGRHEKVSK